MFTSLVTSEAPTSKPLTSISMVSIIENEIKEHGDKYQTEVSVSYVFDNISKINFQKRRKRINKKTKQNVYKSKICSYFTIHCECGESYAAIFIPLCEYLRFTILFILFISDYSGSNQELMSSSSF